MRSRHVPRSVSLRVRRRLTAGALAGTMLFAACGGADEPATGAEAGTESPGAGAELPDTVDEPAASTEESADVSAPAVDGRVDLVGAEVIDAANIETNLLPDVVIDDLTNDRKVNFRNLVPQGKPILLWMYAPH